jgi:RNA polymerase sigma-70 factor (ECF subfamily)
VQRILRRVKDSDEVSPPQVTLATVHVLHAEAGAGEPAIDPELVLARAREGHPAAQRALFELHKDRVAAQIQRMTGDPTVVDDLLQEVFIAAFGSLHSFRGDSQVRTWLYRIATNKVRNWWDSTRRRRRREHVAGELLPDDVGGPQEDLEAREHRERLYQALGELSPKLREAFVARVIEGMSLQDASEALEVPISTISYRTLRAEELLCRALGLAPEDKP